MTISELNERFKKATNIIGGATFYEGKNYNVTDTGIEYPLLLLEQDPTFTLRVKGKTQDVPIRYNVFTYYVGQAQEEAKNEVNIIKEAMKVKAIDVLNELIADHVIIKITNPIIETYSDYEANNLIGVSVTVTLNVPTECTPTIADFNPLAVLNEFVIDAKQTNLANNGVVSPNDLVYYWSSGVKHNSISSKTLIYYPEYLQDNIYFANGKSLELTKNIEFTDGQPFCCQIVISRTLDGTNHVIILGLSIYYASTGGGILHDGLGRTSIYNTNNDIVLANAVGAGVIKLAGERQILTITRDSSNFIRVWQNTTEIPNIATTFGGTILFARLGTRHGSYLADNIHYFGVGDFAPTDEQRINLINTQISKFNIS